MCGIFGTTEYQQESHLQETLRLLSHRGPDSCGQAVVVGNGGRSFLLQHTRLAIQDLSPSGHQPMLSQCDRWAITFNGEIYNHFELRKKLNIVFRGTSDTETLVEYIAAYGIDETVKQLNGIFAFAALDKDHNRLFLVRDPFGIKPVYFYHQEKVFSFSSEIKPLQALHGKQGANLQGLGLFLALRYTPSPDTLLKNIHRLPPGHIGIFDLNNSSFTAKCFAEPTRTRFSGSIEEAVEQYNLTLSNAIKRQLIGDVPLGILLSGGVDSAFVAHHARHHPGLTGYTVGFGDNYSDCEIRDAQETAKALNIQHKSININPESLIDELPSIVDSVEEPLGTTSIMAMWSLTQLAKRDVTVVLTGQGSDEPWGGYRRYKVEHILDALPFLKNSIFRPLGKLSNLFDQDALRRGLNCVGAKDSAERFRLAYSLFDDSEIQNFFSRYQPKSVEGIQSWLNWLPSDYSMNDTERMMRIDTRMNLADDLLLYGDKISMAFALEARVPMLDAELIQFIESLPLNFRSNFGKTKIVHKMAAHRFLPGHIVNRKKKGFQVPFTEWSRSVWKDTIEDYLLDRSNSLYDVISIKDIEKYWRMHLHTKSGYGRQIFALLCLFIWSKKYL